MFHRRNIVKINATQKHRNEPYVVLAIYQPHFGKNDVMKGVKKEGNKNLTGGFYIQC